MQLIKTTIAGPVGSFVIRELAAVPKIPDIAPKNAERVTMIQNLLVHCLAATAGAINMALIRITPTVCSPIIIAITIKKDNSRFNLCAGKPRVLAYSESKIKSLNSFQNNRIRVKSITPQIIIK